MDLINKAKHLVDKAKEEIKAIKGEKPKNRSYHSSKDFQNKEAAQEAFIAAKTRLFNVNEWTNIPAIANSSFQLYHSSGQINISHKPKVGDFIKIILPGISIENWVEVVDLKEQSDLAEFTVMPSHSPLENSGKETKHFFHDEAKSIFRVEKRGTEIWAWEIGLNEKINNEGQESGERAVLNTLVAEGGWAGFQRNQWKNLTDYIIA